MSLRAHTGQFTFDALALLAQVRAAQGNLAEAATLATHVVHSPLSNEAARTQSRGLLADLAARLPPEGQPDLAAAAAPEALDRLLAALVAERACETAKASTDNS
jgi:hypothetical protein